MKEQIQLYRKFFYVIYRRIYNILATSDKYICIKGYPTNLFNRD